jgi:AraC-like DNA-binding protein
MPSSEPLVIKTISEFHQMRKLPKPMHPLFSVIDFKDIRREDLTEPVNVVQHYYSIAMKRMENGSMRYGQQQYDFEEGILFFMAPGQVYTIYTAEDFKHTGWLVLFHADFLWQTSLAKTIKQYDFFSYSVNEALFLSEKEEQILNNLVAQMRSEYEANIDRFSCDLLIAHLELLLTYGQRFYHRQFLTRKIANHKILEQLEDFLDSQFNDNPQLKNGLPTVQEVAGHLNVTPNYLGSVLKVLTGQSTQQHIHDKLIDKAKEQLSTTGLSVSEIAYALGFEHPQSFSKLFKSKTNFSPLAFRQSFN